jgi:hypothetical protein
MAVFKCYNTSCDYSIDLFNTKFKSVGGQLIPSDLDTKCPKCSGHLVLNESTIAPMGEVSISFQKFNSGTPLQKKEMLRKRSKDHFKKFDEKEVSRKRFEAMREIRESFESHKKL